MSILRTGARYWEASAGCATDIWMDRKGGYGIFEGNSTFAYAWPVPPTQRNSYAVVVDTSPWKRTRSKWTLRRATRSSWDVLKSGRRVAYTRGPDGVPAGLAYATLVPDCREP